MPDTHKRSLVAASSGCAGVVLMSVCTCPMAQDVKANLATLMLNLYTRTYWTLKQLLLFWLCTCFILATNLIKEKKNWSFYSNCQCVVLKNHTLSAQSSGFQKDRKFLLNLSLHQKEEQSVQTECWHVGGPDLCSNQDSQTFFSSSVGVFFLCH